MRDSPSPDQHGVYNSAPLYPPLRRSGRTLYETPQQQQQQQQQPTQYHTSAASLPSDYALGLSPYPPTHGISASSSPQPTDNYMDSFSGMQMPDVLDMNMDSTSMGIDLGILSAEEHHDLRILEERARRSGPARSEPEVLDISGSERKRRHRRAPSDESTDTTTSGKPSATKKQRGRPRLDPKDENAADRRRTQIRLAQRAYRLRKETTISSLRNRVTQLEGSVEAMQSTFFEMHSSAMDFIKELDSPAQQEAYSAILRTGAERFVAVARGAIGQDSGDSLGEEDTGDDQPHSRQRPRSRDDGGPASGGTSNNTSMPSWGGYQIAYGRDPQQEAYDTQQGGSTSSSSRATYETPAQDPIDNIFYQNFNLFPAIRQELDPVSYSFQESSFSRRLHRACLESAHHLLSTASAHQHEVSKTFAYSRCYASREEILSTITRMLRGGATDPLNPSAYAETGPAVSNEAYEISLRASMGRKQLAMLGITDKFLKPVDVEQRLVEKGLQADIDASNASDHAGSPASSQDLGYHSSGCSNGSMDSTANCCDVDMETGFSAASEAVEEVMHMQPVTEGAKRRVDMDVLIKELTKRGVCLGDYPGFKPSDVDDCISIASRQTAVF